MSSSKYKPHQGPSELTEQLCDKVKELQAELVASHAEANDLLLVELARHELFESSLLATLQVQGIELSRMPIASRTPHGPQALT